MMDFGKEYLSVTVQDKPGVLQRVSGLFSRRGYNIDSVTVGGSEREGFSRMIIAVQGEPQRIAQIVSQLSKLIDVVQVARFGSTASIARELMLLKLSPPAEARSELRSLLDLFNCPVLEAEADCLFVQVVGDKDKNDAFLSMISRYGIQELSRTGETALAKIK
ncbi:acetolactate synthase small subunit [Cohnella sp. AR92]|uniref:acetolactate synthase small subunit n=1 Tax=Cohnella sp. AR92 TaxID=648716 RepID=UPI000F8CFADD|nr:acetolactate synthase small subunit [Cohnella sp. AR92]RUS43082.1 acetolactate synthase small subunit [Cohnella sp. AR92]